MAQAALGGAPMSRGFYRGAGGSAMIAAAHIAAAGPMRPFKGGEVQLAKDIKRDHGFTPPYPRIGGLLVNGDPGLHSPFGVNVPEGESSNPWVYAHEAGHVGASIDEGPVWYGLRYFASKLLHGGYRDPNTGFYYNAGDVWKNIELDADAFMRTYYPTAPGYIFK